MPDFANAVSGSVVELLTAATAVVTGAAVTNIRRLSRTYQAIITGTGVVSATVLIEVSNDGTNWLTLATLSPAGTTLAADGAAIPAAPWPHTRARLTAISGTGAAVTVTMGV